MSWNDPMFMDPFESMRRMQQEMNQMFGSMLSERGLGWEGEQGQQGQRERGQQERGHQGQLTSTQPSGGQLSTRTGPRMWWPSIDVKENDKSISVKADLPGMAKL